MDVEDLQTGNVEVGKKYFDRACSRGHSPGGDFVGIAKKLEGLTLLQRMLYPSLGDTGVSHAKVIVTRPSGEAVTAPLSPMTTLCGTSPASLVPSGRTGTHARSPSSA